MFIRFLKSYEQYDSGDIVELGIYKAKHLIADGTAEKFYFYKPVEEPEQSEKKQVRPTEKRVIKKPAGKKKIKKP